MQDGVIESENIEVMLKKVTSPLASLVKATVGVAISDPKELLISASGIYGAVIKNEAMQELKEQYEFYKQKGTFKEKQNSKTIKSIFSKLLDTLEKESDDEEKLEAARSLFFSAISKETSEHEELKIHELIKICLKLSGTQILILKKMYEYGLQSQDPKLGGSRMTKDWLELIAEDLSLGDVTLVRKYIDQLKDEGLIAGYFISSPGVSLAAPNLVSHLGKIFCEFILKYPSIK